VLLSLDSSPVPRFFPRFSPVLHAEPALNAQRLMGGYTNETTPNLPKAELVR